MQSADREQEIIKWNWKEEKEFQTLKDVESSYIEEVIKMCGGNKVKAAKILGISPVTIWRKLGNDKKKE